jgi:hypothetical protein
VTAHRSAFRFGVAVLGAAAGVASHVAAIAVAVVVWRSTPIPADDDGAISSDVFLRSCLWAEAAVALICVGGGAALIATRRLSFGAGLLLGWGAIVLAVPALLLINASASVSTL